MPEPGRDLTQADQPLALARHRVHAAHGLEEALDEVDAERKPLACQLTQLPRAEPEHPARGDCPGGREVLARLVPRMEAARPLTRPFHRHHHDRGLAPGARRTMATCPSSNTHQQSGGVALLEELLALLEVQLLTDREQLAKLAVGQRFEQEERTKVFDVHQIVVR